MVIHGTAGTGPIAPRSHCCPTAPSIGEEPIVPFSLDTRSRPGVHPAGCAPSEGRERGCCAVLSLRRHAGSVPAGATASLQTSLTPPKVTLSLLQPGPGTPGGDGALGGGTRSWQAGTEPPVLQHPQGWGMLLSAHPNPLPPRPAWPHTRLPGPLPVTARGVRPPARRWGSAHHPRAPAALRSRSLAGSIHNGYCS